MGGKPRAGQGKGPAPGESTAEVLAGWSPGARRIARTLASTLAGMIDGVTQGGDPAAGAIWFRRRDPGRFCFAQEAPGGTVRVGFEHGHALPDLGGAFEPGGAGPVRYLHLRRPADVQTRPVKLLLSTALYDDETHGFRSRVKPPPRRRR